MFKMEFVQHFEKLLDVFSVTREEKKITGYFPYFEHKSVVVFEKTVETWVRTKSRFPTVAELLECYEIFNTQEGFKGCDKCTGTGWVYGKGENFVRRGDCEHGRRLAEYVGPVYTGELESQPAIMMLDGDMEVAWSRDIMANPRGFIQGYKFVSPIFYRHNMALFDRVAKIGRDALGKDRFDKYFASRPDYIKKTAIKGHGK